MNMQTKMPGICALLFLFLINSCASSKITGEWKDPQFENKKYTNILVIGVAKQPDRRKFYEDEFAKQLRRQGVMAISSHTIIPRDKMQDKDTIVKSIEGLNVDGVIITRLQGVKEVKEFTHGSSYQVPYGYYNNMHEYYDNSLSAAPSRSYVETHEYLQLESNLYDAETEKLAYTITTDTFVRQKFESRIIAYIETVVRKLQDSNLL